MFEYTFYSSGLPLLLEQVIERCVVSEAILHNFFKAMSRSKLAFPQYNKTYLSLS